MNKITDHSSRALERLAEQLKNKPNLSAVLEAFADQHQIIEDAAWNLYTDRSLETAYGLQLDRLGRLVNEPRAGLEDGPYRIRLKAKLKLDRASGAGPEILEIIGLLTTNTLELVEQFPAAIVLRVKGITAAADAPALASILQRAKAAGVRAILEWTESDPADAFAFDNGGLGFDQGNFAGGAG